MTQSPLAVSKLFAHKIMDTSFPPSYSLNLDLYEEEESTLCCVKITKFYRKNQPFIYEFKDTEGNNHSLEIVFTQVDHYYYEEPDDGVPNRHTSIHFWEEARLRRLALKAFEIYKKSGKVVLINPDRALDSLELAEDWWNESTKLHQNQLKNNLDRFLVQFKNKNPNFPITLKTKKVQIGMNVSVEFPTKSVAEAEEILKFARFIGAYESDESSRRNSKKKNQRKIDGCDIEANHQNSKKRIFVRKDLSGMEHELQIDASDCKYQEYLKAEALAKQSFKIYKQGGPVIIIDANFALGTKAAAEKWFEMRKKQALVHYLILGIIASICITGNLAAIKSHDNDHYMTSGTLIIVQTVKIALMFILISLVPAAMFRIFIEFRERELIEIDGQKYSKNEFRIYQVMIGGNLDWHDAGSHMQLKLN